MTGCLGKIVVTDSIFKSIIDTAFRTNTLTGQFVILDSTFFNNEKILAGSELDEIIFMECTISGRPELEDVPNINMKDIGIINSNTILIKDSNIEKVTFSVNSTVSVTISGGSVEGSIISISDCGNIAIVDATIDISNVAPINEDTPPIYIFNAQSISIKDSSLSGLAPTIELVETAVIRNSIFKSGIKLIGVGDKLSEVIDCNFGDTDNPDTFTQGIQMIACKGFNIDKNSFIANDEMTVVDLLGCSYLKYGKNNQYLSECVISVTDGEENSNHFVVDTSQDSSIPKARLDTSSIFNEVFSVVVPVEYIKLGNKPLTYSSLDEVLLSLKKNIVSLIDFRKDWVPYYVKTVNDKLNYISSL
jgi:hypothetical protein